MTAPVEAELEEFVAREKLRNAIGTFMLDDGRAVLVYPDMAKDDMWRVLRWAMVEVRRLHDPAGNGGRSILNVTRDREKGR